MVVLFAIETLEFAATEKCFYSFVGDKVKWGQAAGLGTGV